MIKIYYFAIESLMETNCNIFIEDMEHIDMTTDILAKSVHFLCRIQFDFGSIIIMFYRDVSTYNI